MKKEMVFMLLFIILMSNANSISIQQQTAKSNFESSMTHVQNTGDENYHKNQHPPSSPPKSKSYQKNSYNTNTHQLAESVEEWYLGESVFTRATFSKSGIDDVVEYGLYYPPTDTSAYDTYVTDLYKTLADDSACAQAAIKLYVSYDGALTTNLIVKVFAGGAGTLHYEMYAEITDTGKGLFPSLTISGTQHIDSLAMDGRGYLTFKIKSFYDTADLYEDCDIYLYLIASNGTEILIADSTYDDPYWGGSYPDAIDKWMRTYIDVLYFERDAVEQHIRSSYYYSSSTTIQHKLSINVDEFTSQIEIYSPTTWNFQSINPNVNVNYDETEQKYVISSISSYNSYVLFFTSSSNYFLAIQDVSDTYLDVGFEGGTRKGFKELTTSLFDVKEIRTDIVSEGYYSLYLEKNTGTSANLDLILPAGEYYLSFDYYFITYHSGMSIAYYSDGWTIDSSVFKNTAGENRWYKAFYYFKVDGTVDGYGRNFCFYVNSPTVKLYLDNIHIWKVSANIQTISPNQYKIQAKFISWDNYMNPVLINEQVLFQLNRRTMYREDHNVDIDYEDNRIFTTFIKTDSKGIATLLYNGTLLEEEYELLIVDLDSYFCFPTFDISEYTDLDRWQATYAVDWSKEVIDTEKGRAIKFTYKYPIDDHITVYEKHDFSDASFKDIDFVVYWYKQNTAVDYRAWTALVEYWSTEMERNNTDMSKTTDWRFVYEDLNHPDQIQSDFDRDSCIYYMNIMSPGSLTASDVVTHYIASYHYVTAQKYYFTPHSVAETDYAKSKIKNAWDFSEGGRDDWRRSSVITHTPMCGFLRFVAGGSGDVVWQHIYHDNLDFDAEEYNTIIIRYRIAEKVSTNIIQFRILIYDYPYDANNYRTYKVSINDDGNWHMVYLTDFKAEYGYKVSLIRIYPSNTDGTNPTLITGDTIDFDFIRIVHIEELLVQTNDYATDILKDAWDFEEDKEDVILNGHASNLVQHDGIIEYDTTDDWDGIKFHYAYIDDLSIDTSYYTVFMARIWGNQHIDNYWNFWFGLDGVCQFNAAGDEADTDLYDGWHIYVIYFDQLGDWNGETINEIRVHQGSGTPSVHIKIDYVRLLHVQDLPYQTIQDYVFIESENNTMHYLVYNDGQAIGHAQDLSFVPVNITAGIHLFSVQPFRIDKVYITQNVYTWFYYVTESDLCTLSFFDQQGNYVDSRTFIVFVDGMRIYGDTFIWSDTTQTKDFEIQDVFGHILYSNPTESYERFKDFILSYYSVKIQNMQSLPVWVEISSNGQSYSSWIFSWEVEEYKVYSGSYTFTIYYSNDPEASFDQVGTNGTYVSYSLTINSDIALLVSGETISDIFGNVMSLQNNLENVNASVHAAINVQTQNITMQFNIQNSNISMIIGNLTILDSNLAGNFTLISDTLQMLNNAFEGNFTAISDFLTVMDSSLQGNFTLITSVLDILDSNLYGNFTAIVNTLNILDSNLSGNFTLIISEMNTIDSNLTGNFTLLINEFYALNSTLAGNFTAIINQLFLMNATITGNVSIVTSMLEILDSNLAGNFTTMLLEIDATNATQVNLLVQTYEYLLDQQNYYTVYFILSTEQGIGLPFETAAVFVNSSYISDFKQVYYVGTVLCIEVRDYFNVILISLNVTVLMPEQLIILKIPLVEQIFENPYSIPVQLVLTNVYTGENVSYTILPQSSLAILLYANSYNIDIIPLEDSVTNSTHKIYFEPTHYKYQDLGYGKKTYRIQLTTIAKPLNPEPDYKEAVKQQRTILIVSLLLNAAALSFASMLIKYGTIRVLNSVLLPVMLLLKNIFGFKPKVLVRDEGGLRFVDVDQYQKLRVREEKGII